MKKKNKMIGMIIKFSFCLKNNFEFNYKLLFIKFSHYFMNNYFN